MWLLSSRTGYRQLLVLNAEQDRLSHLAVDVHLGIERDARQAVFVPDRQASDIELSAAKALAGQVALDGRYFLALQLHAAQELQVPLGALQERHGIDIGIDT